MLVDAVGVRWDVQQPSNNSFVLKTNSYFVYKRYRPELENNCGGNALTQT